MAEQVLGTFVVERLAGVDRQGGSGGRMGGLVDDLVLAVDVDYQSPVFLAVVILQPRHEDDVAELWGDGFGEAGDFLEHQGVLCSVV